MRHEAAPLAEGLAFEVAGVPFVLPASAVLEVIRVVPWTRVPCAPASLLGMANLRGAVLPVICLATMLGLPPAPATAAARIIVLDTGGKLGVLVDAVAGVGRMDRGQDPGLDGLVARDFAKRERRADGRGGDPATLQPALAEALEQTGLVGVELAGREFALPLDAVTAIIALPPRPAAMPGGDAAMLGAVSVRGALVPLVSLGALLGFGGAASAPDVACSNAGVRASGWAQGRARVVVTQVHGTPVGLVVDAVTTILRVPPSAIDPVPPVLIRGSREARVEAIARLGSGPHLVSILCPSRLFDSETAIRILAAGEQEPAAPIEAAAAARFLVFQLGDEHYGVPVAAVDAVVRAPAFGRVPHAPDFVRGVMNLRGRVVPVLDQHARFAAPGPRGGGRLVVVLTVGGLQAGMVVDGVSAVLSVPAADLRPAPPAQDDGSALFDGMAIGRGGQTILLVDPAVLLGQAERDVLAAFAAPGAVAA